MLFKIKGANIMALNWYLRICGADPNDPASYILIGVNPPNCVGICKICAILTYDDGFGYPIIDNPLKAQMITALNTCTNQPRVLLRSAC